MKKDEVTKVLLMIIAVIFFFIALFTVLENREVKECLNNPFIYGAKELTDKNDAEVECFCQLEGKPSIRFEFNTTGMYVWDVYKTDTRQTSVPVIPKKDNAIRIEVVEK